MKEEKKEVTMSTSDEEININNEQNKSNDNSFRQSESLLLKENNSVSGDEQKKESNIDEITQKPKIVLATSLYKTRKTINVGKNIGNNFIFKGKYVFGPLHLLFLLIISMISGATIWVLWVIISGNYYSVYLYIYVGIYLIFTEYYMLQTYLIEPGIIPRNHPQFINPPKLDEENKSEEEKKKEEAISRIYTETKCPICNIYRPLGTSHCASCDNCILDLDHHCGFVSNCIGRRNHKHFYLFLFFGTLLSLHTLILNFITIWDVIIIHYHDTLYYMYKGSKTLFYLGIIFMIFPILNLGNPGSKGNCVIFLLTGAIIFITGWYKYVPKNEKMPSYYSPFIVIIFLVISCYGLFIIGNFCGQSFALSLNTTVKQSFPIEGKLKSISYINPQLKAISKYTNQNKTIKEMLMNLIFVVISKTEKSLIDPERDL